MSMEIIDDFYCRAIKSHLRDITTLSNHRIKICKEINDNEGEKLNEVLKRYAILGLKKLERSEGS